MLEAIDERRAHDRLPHLRLLGGRDRHRVRRAARGTGRRPASGCGCCSTRGARDPMDRDLDRRRWRRPACTCAGSGRCAGCGSGQVNHRTHRKVLDRRRGRSRSPAASASPTSGRATPATSTSGATPTSASTGPAVDGLRAAFLDNWAETDPELFDDGVDRFPDQPKPGRVDRAVRARRVGDRLERRRHPVPHAAAVGRAARPDHDRVLRPRRRAHRPALRRGRPRRARCRSCCPAPTPTSGSCSSPARRRTTRLLDARRRALELPAVDAARQGHDGRRHRREHRLGQPQRPLDRAATRRSTSSRSIPSSCGSSTSTSTTTSSAACRSRRSAGNAAPCPSASPSTSSPRCGAGSSEGEYRLRGDGDRCPADPCARGAGRARVPAHHRRSSCRRVRRGRVRRRPRRRTR